MARGRKPRTWIKIDCDGVLRGSINYILSLKGQAIWIKMIALSEVCGGRAGYIEDNNKNGLPHEFIAHELHCTVDEFLEVLNSMKTDKAIEINGTGAIRLVNFDHYQFGEYDRQKPYRDKQKEALHQELSGDKKVYGEFENVYLTNGEYNKLTTKYTEIKAKELIERLSSGIASKGYKYKSHYATILTWERMGEKDTKTPPSKYGDKWR